MNESYFIHWIRDDGVHDIPVLANDCHSFEEAAAWALTWDFPAWATGGTQFDTVTHAVDTDAGTWSPRRRRWTVDEAREVLGME